jgi:hypothetical protein
VGIIVAAAGSMLPAGAFAALAGAIALGLICLALARRAAPVLTSIFLLGLLLAAIVPHVASALASASHMAQLALLLMAVPLIIGLFRIGARQE